MIRYAELAAASNFSFLRGASHPADMVARAAGLGMAGIGIADRNTVAGVVRAHAAWKALREDAPEFRLVVGARLGFVDDTPDIIAYPATRHGWGRLTRLLTLGNRRAEKGDCILRIEDLFAHLDDLLLIALPPATAALLVRLREAAPGRVWLGATMPRAGADRRCLAQLMRRAQAAGVPLVALGDALYAAPQDRVLQDVLTCIREKTTIHEAGRRLHANAERHLKCPVEMARLFADCPEALVASGDILSRIDFTLDRLKYEYPQEPVPAGWNAQDWLEHLVMQAAIERYGHDLPSDVRRRLDEEFALIREQDYACYFLTVHDIVSYARGRGVLCQGRGSAANSIVCFLLGVTSVDPSHHQLLFSRFLSSERREPPDIDVDFEHEWREEVMQYVYRRYGRDRAGIVATVIHYRPRSAVREVGKVLGIGADVTARLNDLVWGSHGGDYERERMAQAGFDPDNPQIARLGDIVRRLLNFPRHLSQHVGGFVLTEGRLDEMVPIHNAAMKERTFIEWDKDDIDELGLMKVDMLALGMLTCIHKSFDLIRLHGLGDHDLTVDLEADDEAVYDMLCAGDSIGVFQVESRAQINMLPRLRPREFYDLVVQVAIVRPGPIEGDMVHPYLRRRTGKEAVVYPSPALPWPQDELVDVLGRTHGVPLFQEQAMKLAITAAAFTDKEANGLRRAMATFRNPGTIENYRDKMIGGMVARGYERDFAERCFKQIEGFGSYGFPESHAQSFARLVYVSAWIKCHHPAVFAAALLNSQPMGFYAPAQIVRDAREHGVEARGVDVNHSRWDCTLERRADGALALRLGMRQIGGFRQAWADAIATGAPFSGVEDLARRSGLPRRALRLLADADAMGSLGLGRRAALWEARRVPDGELPLFAAARAREMGDEATVALPVMGQGEEIATDYQTTRLSLKGHPMAILRPIFARDGVTAAADIARLGNGTKVTVAGVVLIRQRPGKGNAIFITLEDEGGVVNILLWARQLERFRRAVMASRLMLVRGELQRSPEGVVHVLASDIVDRSGELAGLYDDATPPTGSPQRPAAHPRNVRLLPRSRDFH